MSVLDDDHPQAVLALILAATGNGPPQSAVGTEAALTALTALRRLRIQLDAWEPHLVAAARAGGASWADLAPAMGVTSRQAAERRYLRIRRSDHDDTTATADERVTEHAGSRRDDLRERGKDDRQRQITRDAQAHVRLRATSKERQRDEAELDRHEPGDDAERLHQPARQKTSRRTDPPAIDLPEVHGGYAMAR